MSTSAYALGAHCGSALQLTFNTCIGNVLYSPTGTPFDTIEAACSSKQAGGMAAWYSCLCDASKAVNVCYDNSCPNDATRGTYRNQQISYCQALAQYSSGSASGISGGAVTGVPTAPVTVAVTTTSTVGSSGSGGGPVLTIPGSGSGSGAQTVTTKASSAVSDAMIAGVIILLISVVILA